MALHRETDGDPETGMQAESDDEEEGERKNDESTREKEERAKLEKKDGRMEEGICARRAERFECREIEGDIRG